MRKVKEALWLVLIIFATICSIALILRTCGIITFTTKEKSTIDVEYCEPGTVLKTVAHLDLSKREELELMYINTEDDVAFYKVADPLYVKPGDTVYTVKGDSVEVLDIDALGFSVPYDNKFHAGMSGSSIFNEDGRVVGIVSSFINEQVVYCLFAE